jgi:DNA-binding winged helix-turn-helix (wHTH) protein
VAARPQPLKLLALLVAHPADVVSREDLQRTLWGSETFVDFEQGVNHAIRELRAALGDTAESPRFIQTLPRRGYRFIAPVEWISVEPNALVVAEAPQPLTETPARTAPTGPPFRWMRAAVVVAATVALGIGGVAAAWRRSESRNTLPAPALAVRPFFAPADPALGIGLANAISARLGGQQVLSVRPDRAESSSDDEHAALSPGATHTVDGEIRTSG